MDCALGRVAAEDLLDTLADVESLALWPYCQVGGDKRVHQRSVVERKASKLVCQAALSRFEPRAGVMGDQPDKPWQEAMLPQVLRTVQGV